MRRKWDGIISMDLSRIGCEDLNWVE